MNYSSTMMADPSNKIYDSIRIGIILPEDNYNKLTVELLNTATILPSLEFKGEAGSELVFSSVGNTVILNGKKEKKYIILPTKNRVMQGVASYLVRSVPVGRGFHWEKIHDVTLTGRLIIKSKNNRLMLINEIPTEHYIFGVIVSEMSPECPVEFIKAQAIASRSWLLSNLGEKHGSLGIDVCNDDCCQRYQGHTNATNDDYEYFHNTFGIVLYYKGSICDTRYSKCCGGFTESFENVWGGKPITYLNGIFDGKVNSPSAAQNLAQETNANQWIHSTPNAYCNPDNSSRNINTYLGKVDIDQSYFRWQQYYPQNEISKLIGNKLSMDISGVCKLNPLKRGSSGRILSLEIKYLDSLEKIRTRTLSSEYAIRQVLHQRFLFSSAFTIETEDNGGSLPSGFMLHGAGWGHGVGLCQMGALNMAFDGYNYKDILHHYYPEAHLKKIQTANESPV
jgi:SpoIID/LytB domain protein